MKQPRRRRGNRPQFIDGVDQSILGWGANANRILVLMFAVGVGVLVVSYPLNLHSVRFEGGLEGVDSRQFPGSGVTFAAKEVGYLWSPNWFLTTTVFLPLAITFFLRARVAARDLVRALAEHRMVVRATGRGIVAEETLENYVRDSSRFWVTIALAFSLISGAFVVFFYLSQVLPWNLVATNKEIETLANNLGVAGPDAASRFDWSAAPAYSKREQLPNAVFSALAYATGPLLGTTLLLLTSLSLLWLNHLFSNASLGTKGYKLALSRISDEERCGIELFDDVFVYLSAGLLCVSLVVASMYLQNVYLGTTSARSILDVVFEGEYAGLFASFPDVNQVLGKLGELRSVLAGGSLVDVSYLALGTYGVFVLTFFGLVWLPLFQSCQQAKSARLESLGVAAQTAATRQARERLKALRIFPGGRLAAVLTFLSVAIVLGCLNWPSFPGFLIAIAGIGFVVWAIGYAKAWYDGRVRASIS